MDIVGIVAGLVLGLVFIAAGALKLVEGPGWLKQAADMEVSRSVAVVVPYLEIIVGVLLAVQVPKLWPAVVAVVMLVAFTVVIVRRIQDGSRPPCSCFGSRSKRPLGAYHVVRNLAFLALGIVVLFTA